jgi:hypothetical protein
LKNRKNIFLLLKKKLKRDPSPSFDKTFWERFETQFGKEKWSLLAYSHMKLAASLVVLVLIFTFALKQDLFRKTTDEDLMAYEIMQNEELFENLDAFLTDSESDEFMELTDEEWEILISRFENQDTYTLAYISYYMEIL